MHVHVPQICDTDRVFWDEYPFVPAILGPGAEHVCADVLNPAHHHHHHHHRHDCHDRHHRHCHRPVSGTLLLFKYLPLAQPPRKVTTVFEEAEAQTCLDVVAASQWKRRALALLVGALRSMKSRWEVEVTKASVEISVGAHAKVCCIQNGICLFLLMGECEKTVRGMRFAQPEQFEADLCTHLEYLCARGCAERHAYVSVVASM